MLTLISGSNRIGSNTRKVVAAYEQCLQARGQAYEVLDLAALPADAFGPCREGERHPVIIDWQERYIRPATHLLVASPEYNGSIPGVLKAFIDYCDIQAWRHKQALLVGVATGRAGNLRGMDHLSNIFLHCGITVHPNKLPIAQVGKLLDEQANLDAGTMRAIDAQLADFLD